jgi:hypothetical protein
VRIGRGLFFGVIGGLAISAACIVLRMAGLNIGIELILGTATGIPPGGAAIAAGLAIHVAVAGAFGVLYAWLFERVWVHGGASTGIILGMIQATLLGMLFGLTPQFHPYVPNVVADPGPYFVGLGRLGVAAWFGLHVLYGAIVGGGYGHVVAERQWAPAGRL